MRVLCVLLSPPSERSELAEIIKISYKNKLIARSYLLAFNAPTVWLAGSLRRHRQTYNLMKTLSPNG